MTRQSRYDLILFDVDDTLLDFRKASGHSLARVLARFAPAEDHQMMTPRFHAINTELWQDLEKGKVTKDQVLVGRFARLFSEFSVNSRDVDASDLFLDGLAGDGFLLDGAESLVRSAAKLAPLGIVSNGHGPTQRKRLARAGLSSHFAFSLISDEVGAAKPDRRIFQRALSEAQLGAEAKVLMIGDNWVADIGGARAAGFDTCWISARALPAGATPPTFVASRLSMVEAWLGQ